MANIIKELKGKAGHLTTLVETEGEYFYVDSGYTWDHGYETMAFESTPQGEVTSWRDVVCRLYGSYEEMASGHYEVIKDLELLMSEDED